MSSFSLCDFCQVETTSPLLFIEIDGFNLDVCPSCFHSQTVKRILMEGEEE